LQQQHLQMQQQPPSATSDNTQVFAATTPDVSNNLKHLWMLRSNNNKSATTVNFYRSSLS